MVFNGFILLLESVLALVVGYGLLFVDGLTEQVVFSVLLVLFGYVLVHPVETLEVALGYDALLDLLPFEVLNLLLFAQFFEALVLLLFGFVLFLFSRPHLLDVAEALGMPRLLVQE